jgi:hypothetical protein
MVNTMKDFRPAKALIAEQRVIDRTQMADTNVSLKEL